MKEKEIDEGAVSEIHRSEKEGKPEWSIVYKPNEFLNTDKEKHMVIDGKTGEILKIEILDMARHLD
ncbi:PepSY domain-containing protein [Fulvivirga maritima]|uniref:PepSY domain-containing protein n=1 Tax=Fulvivirga maritima TaxID=2904247 RepID=UPI001F338E0C|nr:PepSY domain-containing protein [Fulvivirga maritima]UII28965.1 PepSY domain-containing protein [Fulvivirga maritima]